MKNSDDIYLLWWLPQYFFVRCHVYFSCSMHILVASFYHAFIDQHDRLAICLDVTYSKSRSAQAQPHEWKKDDVRRDANNRETEYHNEMAKGVWNSRHPYLTYFARLAHVCSISRHPSFPAFLAYIDLAASSCYKMSFVWITWMSFGLYRSVQQ